jgi:hypothetical protein
VQLDLVGQLRLIQENVTHRDAVGGLHGDDQTIERHGSYGRLDGKPPESERDEGGGVRNAPRDLG